MLNPDVRAASEVKGKPKKKSSQTKTGTFEAHINATRNSRKAPLDDKSLNSSEDSQIGTSEEYLQAFERSIENPEAFWADIGKQLEWTKPWDRVLDNSNPPFTKWYSGGELNVCHNAVDRHVKAGHGGVTALIHDSPLTSCVRRITYDELLSQVSSLAGALSSLGVRRGSRVLVYMPLIPEAVVAMLAPVRLGAVHSVVFGGFAARELRTRIEHAEPTVIIAASCGVEPNKIVRYKEILDEALSQSQHQPEKCIIFQRHNVLECELTPGRDITWEEALTYEPHPCVPIEANEPLYILYTSGTTDAPKGVQRPCGGHAAVLAWSMSAFYGMKQGDVWWAASDLGWVVGHSYICYGPLLAGMTSVLFEGKPDRTPDPGQYFRIIEQHRVNAIFTIPTVFRVLKRVDPSAKYGRRYCIKSLKRVFIAGEHCDRDTKLWAEQVLGVPVLNHWWQTESGSAITAVCAGLGVKRAPRHSAGYPAPGYNMRALRESGELCAAGEVGRLAAKLPLPPGFASTLWRADERFNETYFESFPGYYDTMDAGYIGADGAVWVCARADDVINVAGHRLSTAALEDVVLRHAAVADAVVIGAPDATKGDVPLCLFVMRPPDEGEPILDEAHVVAELITMIRQLVGPIAAFHRAAAVGAVPRTRSGKALRSCIAQLARGLRVRLPATVEDPSVFVEIKAALQKLGYATNAPDPSVY